MAKIKITENELKELIRESVENIINEGGFDFSLNPVTNIKKAAGGIKNAVNGAKNMVNKGYNYGKNVAKNAYNRVSGKESENLQNQIQRGQNDIKNLQTSNQDLTTSRDNLLNEKKRLLNELQQIASKLNVSYSASPVTKDQLKSGVQTTGVNAILTAIDNLQKKVRTLYAQNKNLNSQLQLAQKKVQNASLSQTLSQTPKIPTGQVVTQAPQTGLQGINRNNA